MSRHKGKPARPLAFAVNEVLGELETLRKNLAAVAAERDALQARVDAMLKQIEWTRVDIYTQDGRGRIRTHSLGTIHEWLDAIRDAGVTQ